MNNNFWQLTDNKKNLSSLITQKQVIIGSSPHCDIVVNDDKAPLVAFRIKQEAEKLLIEKLASNVIVNGQDIQKATIKENDQIEIGQSILTISKATQTEKHSKNLWANFHNFKNQSHLEKVDYLGKPIIELDTQVLYSRLLIENRQDIYPTFVDSQKEKQIEIAVCFKNKLITLHQLKNEYLDYFFTGKEIKSHNFINLPFLKSSETFPFLKLNNGQLDLKNVPGVELKISEPEKPLTEDNIAIFTHGDYQIYVRSIESKKTIKPPPFFGRDKRYPLIFIPLLILGIIFQLVIFSIKVDKEEIRKQAPKKIAKILYRPKELQVSSSPTPDKEKAAPKKEIEVKKSKVTPKKVTKKKEKVVVKKEIAKKVTSKVLPRPIPKPVRPKLSSKFANLFNSNLAKRSGHKKANDGEENLVNLSSSNQGFDTGKLRKIKTVQGKGRGTQQGDYSAGEFKGAKNGPDFNSVSYKTVVLGSIDPAIVKKIILDNIPDMTFCYEQGLSTHNKKDMPSSAFIEFTIGATGHVTAAKVNYKSKRLPAKSHQCLIRIIKSMKFPSPKGGGFVNVKQPINFTH